MSLTEPAVGDSFPVDERAPERLKGKDDKGDKASPTGWAGAGIALFSVVLGLAAGYADDVSKRGVAIPSSAQFEARAGHLAGVAARFHEDEARWPRGISELEGGLAAMDPWDRAYALILSEAGGELVSYGEDGVEGGDGPDADLRAWLWRR